LSAYDAIVIPGGGVRDDGVLPAWVIARFDRAIELAADAWLMPLSAGTPYRPPPLDERGFPIFEARAGAEYLESRGVDPRRILIEESSYDTIGNAYFSRVVHIVPRGFRRVLVITSAFHMPRTEAVFRWVYSLDSGCCSVDFESVPDVGIDAGALAARIAKERTSLETFGEVRARIGTLAELHRWLFTEHAAYRAGARSSLMHVDTTTY
jgi:hypothetical protein